MKLFRTDRPKPPYWPPQTSPAAVARALDYVRYRDPYGNAAHQVLAIAYCLTLPLSTAANGVAFALLALYGLIRTPNTWRCYNPLLLCAALGGVVLFIGWEALGVTWSADASQGLDELAAARVMALPLMLWPVIDKAWWYIAAALVGVAAQNVIQVLQLLELLSYEHGASGRLGGWMHPIQTGAWCAAAVCWHGSALMTAGLRRWRVVSAIGLLLSGAGLIATGSRGPWIAAAVGCVVLSATVLLRAAPHRRWAAIVIGAGVIACGLGWLTAREFVNERISGAAAEYRAAIDHQQYWTSTGSRIAFWSWATDIWHTAPLAGTGTGSFPQRMHALPDYGEAVARARRSAVRELDGYDSLLHPEQIEALPGYDDAVAAGERRVELYLDHDHAHSTYFHVLAGLGLVGLSLLLLMLVLIARQCALDPRTHPYVDGTLAVLAVWIVGAQFDCYHLNGHLLGMLALTLAITLPNRAAGEAPR